MSRTYSLRFEPMTHAKGVALALTLKATDAKSLREKTIFQYMFLQNLNAREIRDLHDPAIICLGNRKQNKPLSTTSILNIVYKRLPEYKEERIEEHVKRKQRNELRNAIKNGVIIPECECAFCHAETKLEVHHIMPLSCGGGNEQRNLIVLCHDCHSILHRIYRQLNIHSEEE